MMCKFDLQIGGIHIHQLFNIPTKYNMTPHRRSYLVILKLINTPQEFIYYVLLIFRPLMKWVNPQQKLFLRVTSSFTKYWILIYIWVVFWSYFLCIILIHSQLGFIHFWHNVTLYLALKWSHLKILYKIPMMIYSNVFRKLHCSIIEGS